LGYGSSSTDCCTATCIQKRFKMVQNPDCDFCGVRETIKHMLWECPRLINLWDKLSRVFCTLEANKEIQFETLFVGYNLTSPILESLITRATRSIVTRERGEIIPMEKIKYELIEHCFCNTRVKNIRKEAHVLWNSIKISIETSLKKK
jgi:hypothetical protein